MENIAIYRERERDESWDHIMSVHYRAHCGYFETAFHPLMLFVVQGVRHTEQCETRACEYAGKERNAENGE